MDQCARLTARWPRRKKPCGEKKAAPKSVGLSTAEVRKTGDTRDVRDLTSRVEDDGGAVLGSYSDPFGGTPILLVALPIDASSRRRISAIRRSRMSSA
jgi:hypothetical protein